MATRLANRKSKTRHVRFFFFNDTATTEIYTLSLHDALPICACENRHAIDLPRVAARPRANPASALGRRSEEHTSELQSPCNLVCRLLLEKKKKILLPFFLFQKKKKKHNNI